MDRRIRVNVWTNTYATSKQKDDVLWSELKEQLKVKVFHHDKTSGKLFNGNYYKEPVEKRFNPDRNISCWYDEQNNEVEVNTNSKGEEYATRGMANVIGTDLLMLDYDNDPVGEPTEVGQIHDMSFITKETVMDWLKGYEYILYSTHSDLRIIKVANLNKDGKLVWCKRTVPYGKGVERFRVVIPFATMCPKDRFEAIVRANGFAQICPVANNESYTPTQFFYEPRYPVDTNPTIVVGNGKMIDWSLLPMKEEEKEVYVPRAIVGEVKKGGQGRILIETLRVFDFCKDMGLRVGRGGGSWVPVQCPWESEHGSKGGTHINQSINGWGFSCKHESHGKKGNKEFIEYFKKLHGWEVFRPYCDCEDVPDKTKEIIERANKSKKLQQEEIDALLVNNVEIIAIDEDGRTHTVEQLRDRMSEVVLHGVTCVGGEEGLGKTYIVILLASKGRKFILCCKSNEQAAKKTEELNEIGLNVKQVRSKEYKFKLKYGFGFERYEPTNPYEIGAINIPATVDKMVAQCGMTIEEATEAYKQIEPDSFPEFDPRAKFSKSHPLWKEITGVHGWVTTFAQMKALQESWNKPLEQIVIIIDDPDVEDVSVLRPYKERYQNDRDNNVFEVVTIDGKEYCRIDRRELLCHSLRNDVLFTTTELCTQYVINHNYNDVNNYTLFRDVKIDRGNVFFIKTKLTQKDYHYFFHLYERVLSKEGVETKLIADGIGAELNLSNNKGRNDLKDYNTLIKISRPHPDRVRWLCAEVGVKWHGWKRMFRGKKEEGITQDMLDEALMLDVMNQAIGRNSGNRFCGKEAVVFVPSSLYGSLLISDSRYMIRDCSIRDKGFANMVWKYVGNAENVLLRKDFENVLIRSIKRSSLPDNVKGEVFNACVRVAQISRVSRLIRDQIGVICVKSDVTT